MATTTSSEHVDFVAADNKTAITGTAKNLIDVTVQSDEYHGGRGSSAQDMATYYSRRVGTSAPSQGAHAGFDQ